MKFIDPDSRLPSKAFEKPVKMFWVGKSTLYVGPFKLENRSRFIFEHEVAGADPPQIPVGGRFKPNPVPCGLFPDIGIFPWRNHLPGDEKIPIRRCSG